MKHLLLVLLLTLTTVSSSLGQHYQTIYSNRVAYFDNADKNIKCIRIDSVRHTRDSVFFPFYEILETSESCYTPNKASWIGKSVTIKENGVNAFVSQTGDTIALHTGAHTGDKWIAYASGNTIIEATVSMVDTLTVLGVLDSVKTIRFQSFNNHLEPLNLHINQMVVQLGKYSGFIKTLNFYFFSDLYLKDNRNKLETFDLVGHSNTDKGVTNLTWLEVFDFQPGDEIHISDHYSCRNSDGSGSETLKESIYIYQERTDHPASIDYTYTLHERIKTYLQGSSTSDQYTKTVHETFEQNSSFDKLPGEPIRELNGTYSNFMTNEFPVSKSYPGDTELYQEINTSDTCWRLLIVDGCISAEKYIKGLGGPYYSCSNFTCSGGMDRRIVFYKKGDKIWGNPLNFSGINETLSAKNIRIYPNPADKIITINAVKNQVFPIHVFLYDIHGHLKIVQTIESELTKLDISDLKSGIYVVKFSDNQTLFKIQKLVVK